MADQQRWFKLWHSALSDDELQCLAPALRWAWVALGCHTKVHGTRGRVIITRANGVLALEMGVPLDALYLVISRLPHVHVEEGPGDNGHFTVTWKNWVKYQEDSTQAERQRASRSKRRGEENRGEQTRKTPLDTSYLGTPWHPAVEEVRTWLVTHEAPHALGDEVYWRRIDDWLGSPTSGVGYLDELAKYLAWNEAQPPPQRHKNLKAGFRKWLAKSEFWSQQRAQTEAHRRQARR